MWASRMVPTVTEYLWGARATPRRPKKESVTGGAWEDMTVGEG